MKARGRLSDESGFTLVEMLVVLAILGIVLAALTTLFVSATRTAADQNMRFQAQQEARLALDSLRREIHCANGVSGAVPGTPRSRSVSAPYCPSTGGTAQSVVWCTQRITSSGTPSPASTIDRYGLWRYTTTPTTCGVRAGGVKKADYLTTGGIFTALPAGRRPDSRPTLAVTLPVDLTPIDRIGSLHLDRRHRPSEPAQVRARLAGDDLQWLT